LVDLFGGSQKLVFHAYQPADVWARIRALAEKDGMRPTLLAHDLIDKAIAGHEVTDDVIERIYEIISGASGARYGGELLVPMSLRQVGERLYDTAVEMFDGVDGREEGESLRPNVEMQSSPREPLSLPSGDDGARESPSDRVDGQDA
jgi:hypothetical protein